MDCDKELRLYKFALHYVISHNPDVKCTKICDGDCLDCISGTGEVARGFHLKENLLEEFGVEDE